MVRRGQQKQRELRRVRKEATEAASQDQGDYVPPPRGECFPLDWCQPYDDGNTIRAEILTWKYGKRLTDFVVNIQILDSSGWVTVEYIDCCHGFCHLHEKSEVSEPTAIHRLDEVYDVQHAFVETQTLILDRMRILRGEGG